jgi:L-lactate permease
MRDHPVVIYGVVALVLLLVLLTGPTDAQRIFPLLILFGFAFVGTEVLRRQTLREFPATT